MGNKIGHAQKLEPPADDASASGLLDTLDLSIADPADCPILDDQAVQEILESGPYPLLDQSMLEEIIEGESPTVRHRYQPKAARVSWARRLLNWSMSRFGTV